MKYPMIILFLTCWFTASSQTTPRDVLFLSGTGQTSPDWYVFYTNGAKPAGYQMNAYNPINTQVYNPGPNSVAQCATAVNTDIANRNNVLGIGHDGGGIVLRQMAKDPNSKLSAMILDGVPNQGSFAIRQCLPNANGSPSYIDDFISKLEGLKSGAQNCQQCEVINAFKNWVSGIKLSAAFYNELTPTSPTISNLGAPTIPTAIIWGNADKDAFTLDRLLSSKSNVAPGYFGDSDYLDCYRRQLDQRRKEIKNNEIDAVFFAVTGLQISILKSQGVVKLDGGVPSVDVSKIADALATLRDNVYKSIEKIRAANKDIAEMLECELIHQLMNTVWNMTCSGGYTVTTEVQVDYLPGDCSYCNVQCQNEGDQFMHDFCLNECMTECMNNPTTITSNVLVVNYFPNDGLLNKNEQLLAGAARTYESKRTNHFEEQFWFNGNIQAPFKDLFDGNGGISFAVPK